MCVSVQGTTEAVTQWKQYYYQQSTKGQYMMAFSNGESDHVKFFVAARMASFVRAGTCLDVFVEMWCRQPMASASLHAYTCLCGRVDTCVCMCGICKHASACVCESASLPAGMPVHMPASQPAIYYVLRLLNECVWLKARSRSYAPSPRLTHRQRTHTR